MYNYKQDCKDALKITPLKTLHLRTSVFKLAIKDKT